MADCQKQGIGVPETALAVIKLIRLNSCLTAGIAGLVGLAIAGGSLASREAVLVFATVFLITGAGNALNDIRDIEIDRINRASRPLPSGSLTIATAWVISLSLFVLGLGLAFWMTWWCLAIAAINSVLLIIYAFWSKSIGILKNLSVGLLVGSVFLFAAVEISRITPTLAILAACAALATFAREVVKDIEDARGDSQHVAATLPLSIGSGPANLVAYGALAAAVLLATVPFLIGDKSVWFLALVILGGLIFAVSAYFKSPSTRQRLIMAGSIGELIAFAIGH